MHQPRDHTRGVSRKGSFNLTTRRLRELERLISFRFPNGILPTSKEADVYLRQAAKLLRRNLHRRGVPTKAQVLDCLVIWAEYRAHHTPAEHLENIVDQAMHRPRIETADELGKLLDLTFEDRKDLKITTIGACDVTKAQRALRRKQQKRERDRERAAKQRLARGMVPRLTWHKTCLSVLRPWDEMGISRRTWERQRKTRMLNDAGLSSPIEQQKC